jgi:hypothetical protein
MSNMAMSAVIERINEDRTENKLLRFIDPKQRGRDITLAHAIANKAEAAYRRQTASAPTRTHDGLGDFLLFIGRPAIVVSIRRTAI